MESGLANKTVLVTGAAGGIGQEIVKSFVSEGARVAIHFNKSQSVASELIKNFDKEKTVLVQGDLRNEREVATIWNEVESVLGPIEVLVANAAIYYTES